MLGRGLLKGLGVTLRTFFSRPFTLNYPIDRRIPASRGRGSFRFDAARCIACEMCAKACPNHVIHVGVARDERNRRLLADYRVETSICLFCGLCAEACPTEAIQLAPPHASSTLHKLNLSLRWEPGKRVQPDAMRAQGDLAPQPAAHDSPKEAGR